MIGSLLCCGVDGGRSLDEVEAEVRAFEVAAVTLAAGFCGCQALQHRALPGSCREWRYHRLGVQLALPILGIRPVVLASAAAIRVSDVLTRDGIIVIGSASPRLGCRDLRY